MTTELQAVNDILATIGEAPFSTLDGDLTEFGSLARTLLDEVSRDVQTQGWTFNVEYNYVFQRDGDDHVPAPASLLAIQFDRSSSIDPVQRGAFFYDRKNQRTTFDSDLTASRCVFLRSWDELSEPFRRYVKQRAARIFCDRHADAVMRPVTVADEHEAKALLMRDELAKEDVRMTDNGLAAQIAMRFVP
jgi:hypothetical protein